MSGDDGELGKFQRYTVEVGNGPPRLRGTKRSGVADLEAERDAKFDALGIERIVAPVIRRKVP